MEEKESRDQQAEGPVKETREAVQPLVAEVVEEVSGERQPEEEAYQGRSGSPPLPARPTRGHVHAPEEPEHPDGAEGERDVKPQPPRLERVGRYRELPPALKKVVEEEPQATRKPESAAHDVDADPSGAPDGKRPLRFSRYRGLSRRVPVRSRRAFG